MVVGQQSFDGLVLHLQLAGIENLPYPMRYESFLESEVRHRRLIYSHLSQRNILCMNGVPSFIYDRLITKINYDSIIAKRRC